MNSPIQQLEPQALWRNFHALTRIPRPSGYEAEVREYLLGFGAARGLESVADDGGNVIIRKPATPGREACRGVVIQGHMDMVPQANSNVVHDFERDPIETLIDGEWVRARNTTLGADNGIGVAAALAVLESGELEHGPLEVLITSDEERGMTGALALRPGALQGGVLLNTDSEEEGELCIGCAGGANSDTRLEYRPEPVLEPGIPFRIYISGLKGGHSGVDIGLGRGNANKLVFRLLKHLTANGIGFALAEASGGNMRNAIPREAAVTLLVQHPEAARFQSAVAGFADILRDELAAVEPDLQISFADSPPVEAVLPPDLQGRLIDALCACPNGVVRMSDSMPGLVETSTNLSTVRVSEGRIEIGCLARSSIDSAREAVCEAIEATFGLIGAETTFDGHYPGWKPDPDSALLKLAESVYRDRFGSAARVGAIHAGLECGLLGAIYPDWEMISFGPTIRFPHSPDERVLISSVERFWDFLTELLRQIR